MTRFRRYQVSYGSYEIQKASVDDHRLRGRARHSTRDGRQALNTTLTVVCGRNNLGIRRYAATNARNILYLNNAVLVLTLFPRNNFVRCDKYKSRETA